YIGTAEHEGDVPPDQVTLSIFRANRPERLFRELAERGQLTPGNVKGIYRVNGLLDIPVQIVITGELEGPEYAACRALTDRAAVEDVEQIIQDGSRETDFAAQEHYRVLLGLVARKNPEVIEEIRRYEAMEREWTDIFKDVIDERINNGIRDTTVACIRNVMESFGVSEERAMESLKIPQNQRAAYADLVRRA
ncbi:MAG: hypothetical protein IJ705_03710, partial [Oscillospiraceae bacterium]|nr:hypothetical protein [Oscillospiraceae bacterium]